jgi:hypothetical protein
MRQYHQYSRSGSVTPRAVPIRSHAHEVIMSSQNVILQPVILLLAMITQAVIHCWIPQKAVQVCPENGEPTPNEFALRDIVVTFYKGFGSNKVLNLLSFLIKAKCQRQSLGLIAWNVVNTFNILSYEDGLRITPVVLSLLLLFDQATVDLIEQDIGFGIQLILCGFCFLSAQALRIHRLTSLQGVVHSLIGICSWIVATFIRYEVWPAIIPFVIVILVDVFGPEHTGVIRRVGKLIGRTLGLLIIGGTTVFLFLVMRAIRKPMMEFGGMTLKELFVELAVNRHNLALFAIVPLGLTFSMMSRTPTYFPSW